MPLEKVWRPTWCVNSSGWSNYKSLCLQGCCSCASGTGRRGRCAINYTCRVTGDRRRRGGCSVLCLTRESTVLEKALERHTVRGTPLHESEKKSRPGLDGLNGHVPPVLRGNVLLCCEQSLPLSGLQHGVGLVAVS